MMLDESLSSTSGSTLAAAIVIHAWDTGMDGRIMPSGVSKKREQGREKKRNEDSK